MVSSFSTSSIKYTWSKVREHAKCSSEHIFFFLLSVVLRQALHPYVAWRFQQTILKNRWLRFWYENMQACAQTNAGTPSTNHCGLYFRPQVPRCFFLLLPKAHISIVRFTCSGAEKCRAVYFQYVHRDTTRSTPPYTPLSRCRRCR